MSFNRLLFGAVAAAVFMTAVPAFAVTPTQSSAIAAKARADALARARSAAETKARLDAEVVARSRVDAAVQAQKKAAIEFVLRNQAAAAKARTETRHAYVVANPAGLGKQEAKPDAHWQARPATHESPAFARARAHPGGRAASTSSSAAGHAR
jgi:hypothetical protein